MTSLNELRDSVYYRKAHKRLSKQSVSTVLAWAETTLWATQAGVEGFGHTHDQAALDEARRGALGLLAALDVLDNHV